MRFDANTSFMEDKKYDLFYYLSSTNSGKRREELIREKIYVWMPSMEVQFPAQHGIFDNEVRIQSKKGQKWREWVRERERER